jgi:hypothetical protein
MYDIRFTMYVGVGEWWWPGVVAHWRSGARRGPKPDPSRSERDYGATGWQTTPYLSQTEFNPFKPILTAFNRFKPILTYFLKKLLNHETH